MDKNAFGGQPSDGTGAGFNRLAETGVSGKHSLDGLPAWYAREGSSLK
jgi:hypothetical protein